MEQKGFGLVGSLAEGRWKESNWLRRAEVGCLVGAACCLVASVAVEPGQAWTSGFQSTLDSSAARLESRSIQRDNPSSVKIAGRNGKEESRQHAIGWMPWD